MDDSGATSPLSPTKEDIKKTRAKHACRICNSRRVRCDVMEQQPCSNCVSSEVTCEVLPSRRGRYLRRSRKRLQSTHDVAAILPTPSSEAGFIKQRPTPTSEGDTSFTFATPSHVAHHGSPEDSSQGVRQSRSDTPRPLSPAPRAATRFFGESNFLTLVPGDDGRISHSGASGNEKPRLTFPISATPLSNPPAENLRISAATMRYLHDEGAFTLPDLQSCLPAIKAYFSWFHPSFPILDRADFTRRLATMEISRMLLQAVLFIGAVYCDENVITAMGFKDRSQAKTKFYTRARLLFHADWEKDEIVLIQSIFLMSFWRGKPADVRDVRYWLGIVITFSESYGLHRSTRSGPKNSHTARMRRRIWWSIYVRERQAAASLGLPSRIRDEDCDIEPLSPIDLESEAGTMNSPFGSSNAEHITYAIKMVEIARLLGRIIDLHFVPGRSVCSTAKIEDLNAALEAWKDSLPESMKGVSEEATDSVWTCLLHLAYNHLRILIYRNFFLRSEGESAGSEVVAKAACRISRIAEDMSTKGTLRYGQMHLITSIFSALCIHTISIRRERGVSRRLAEHRAETCLLCLKEVQKYWRVNNNVLDLFLQCLDRSIAARLHGSTLPDSTGSNQLRQSENTERQLQDGNLIHSSREDFPAKDDPFTGDGQNPAHGDFEEQYSNLINGNWESEDALAGLGMFLQGEESSQTCNNNLNFLGILK